MDNRLSGTWICWGYSSDPSLGTPATVQAWNLTCFWVLVVPCTVWCQSFCACPELILKWPISSDPECSVPLFSFLVGGNWKLSRRAYRCRPGTFFLGREGSDPHGLALLSRAPYFLVPGKKFLLGRDCCTPQKDWLGPCPTGGPSLWCTEAFFWATGCLLVNNEVQCQPFMQWVLFCHLEDLGINSLVTVPIRKATLRIGSSGC